MKNFIFDTSEKTCVQYFKVYKYLPLINAVFIFVLFFILGLIGLFKNALEGIIFWLIGAFAGCLSFFFTKVIASYRLLHIHYLQKNLQTKGIESTPVGLEEENICNQQINSQINLQSNNIETATELPHKENTNRGQSNS